MISFRDLSRAQQSLVAIGAGFFGASIIGLVALSDLDLSPIRTLRAVHVGGGGSIISTQYNPFGILGVSVIGLAVVVSFALVMSWLMPKLGGGFLARSAGGLSGDVVAKAGYKIERELSKVLELIRAHIASNDSYAQSLSQAQTRLAGLPEGEQVRVVVSLLVAENERMRRESGDLKDKLEDSRRQIETLRASLDHAEEIVLKDPLTGIGNRRCFDVSIDKAISDANETGNPLSLIMCDIDHFKRINDQFGHQVGDEIIKMFSRIIEKSIREGDTVIRYGGEEFAIILPKAGQSDARAVAERIRRQVEGKKLTVRETNENIGKMTASFGVAEHQSGDAVEMLIRRADSKLYDAKSRGRNRVSAYGDA